MVMVVDAEELSFSYAGGSETVRLARPPGASSHGVVLVSDIEAASGDDADPGWPGLADRLADAVPACVAVVSLTPSYSPSAVVARVRAVARALRLDPRSDGTVSVIGYGLGGAAAVVAAALEPIVAGVAALATPVDLPQAGYGSDGHLATMRSAGHADPADPSAWRREFIAQSPVHHLSRLVGRPILVVHGAADTEVAPAQSEILARATGNKVRVLPTAGHRLRHNPVAIDLVIEFLKVLAQ